MARLYRIYDAATLTYSRVMEARTDQEAMRALSALCWDPEHTYHKHAEHYTLYAVGEINDFDARLVAFDAAELVVGLSGIRDRAPQGFGVPGRPTGQQVAEALKSREEQVRSHADSVQRAVEPEHTEPSEVK